MAVRPFRPSDREAVNALHAEVWWPERSEAGWAWLDANPARADIAAPSGWVAEDAAGTPVAFVGNLVQRFWQDDVRSHGATGFSIIVPPTVRGASRALIRAVVRQPDVFAVYTFNANSRSALLYARHDMVAWPPRTHGLKLSWTIDPIALLQGRVLREAVRRAPHLTDPYRERFMTRRLGSPRPARLPTRVSPLIDLSDGSAYDLFWRSLRAEGRLVADRSPEILRWRMSDPDRTSEPVLLAYRRAEVVAGYAMALMSKATPIDPAVLEIIDLVALESDDQAIPDLMRALMAEGRALGAAKVRLQLASEELLRRLGPWVRGARREGGWGHGHVRFNAGGPDHHAWSPTPFDADHAFCQRPTPPALRRGQSEARAQT